MKGKTHALAGATLSVFTLGATSGDMRWMIAGGVAALIPDVDTRKSILGRFIPLWLFLKHRAFTHSYIALLSFTLFTYWFTNNISACIAVFTGYLSHLWLDWTTKRGVMLWWPNKQYYSLRKLFRVKRKR